jgi:hypothetical protein
VVLGTVGKLFGSSSADLEATLVVELALFNFEEAMHYVRMLPEDQRLGSLARIIQRMTGAQG